MARKIFISYKYDEASNLRDRIILSLGKDAQYYTGETSDSPDLTDYKTETIRKHLKDMIFNTSVTIVIISPNMKRSNWIPWEIQYSLTEYVRNDRTSRTNGIIAIVMKVNGSYDWFINSPSYGYNWYNTEYYKSDFVPSIISKNRENTKIHPRNFRHYMSEFNYIDNLNMKYSYISYVTEDSFLSNPHKYIESAYDKSLRINEFNIDKRSEAELNRTPMWW